MVQEQPSTAEKSDRKTHFDPFTSLTPIRQSVETCFINKNFEVSITPKFLPFFHSWMFESDPKSKKIPFEKLKDSGNLVDLRSFGKSKREVQFKIVVFKKTRNLSGLDTLKNKLENIHRGHILHFKELSYIDFPSPIKMIIWVRINFRMKKEDHLRFMEAATKGADPHFDQKFGKIDISLQNQLSF